MADFVQALRMNNLFPDSGNVPLGPPTNNGINVDEIMRLVNPLMGMKNEQINQQRRYQDNVAAREHANRLAEIAASVAGQHNTQPSQPMNTVYNPSISDLDKAKLALTSRGLDIRQAADKDRANVQNRREDIRSDMNSLHDLTDSQRLNQQLSNREDIENLRQTGRTGLETQRETGRTNLQTLKGKQTESQISARGEQRRQNIGEQTKGHLEEIGRRAEEARTTLGAKPTTPTQDATNLKNKLHEIVLTRPDLAQHLKFDDKGNPSIDPNAPLGAVGQLHSFLYGSDVNLPKDDGEDDSEDTTSTSSTKSDTKSDPLGIR